MVADQVVLGSEHGVGFFFVGCFTVYDALLCVMTDEIRLCEHPRWPFLRDRGFASSANNLISRKAFMPLDSEDVVFAPDAHDVYVFETIYNKRLVWYRRSNMVAVGDRLYCVYSGDNLFESYAWSVHKNESPRAAYLVVRQTPLKFTIGRCKLSVRGIGIGRDTGLFLNRPYFVSCSVRRLQDYYELPRDFSTGPDTLNPAIRLLQRWIRNRLNRKSKRSLLAQYERHGYFNLLPEDVLLVIEAHLIRMLFRPRQVECEFTVIPNPGWESVFT